MRVLVTGGSGFIGSHVARHLVAHGHDVIATGRDRARLRTLESIGCRIVPADLSADELSTLVDGRDAVIHCAARAAPWGPRSAFWKDNVVATERLVDATRRSGSVQRFVFVSSPSIYFRPQDQLQLTEEFAPPARWLTAYAETKWVSECRVLAAPEINPVVLRPRAVFGPGDAVIVPRLIAVANSGFFPLPGGGAAWTDVTYIENVVDAIVQALVGGDEVVGKSFNITNGESIRISDLLQRLFAALNLRPRFIAIPRGLAFGLAGMSERIARGLRVKAEPRLTRYGIGLLGYSQTLSIEAARRSLGYSPRISVDEGIARYARWRATQ
ncbi:MAG TPA: NAD(P)-dependent oxidoreductase [Steroidobacter sp.]